MTTKTPGADANVHPADELGPGDMATVVTPDGETVDLAGVYEAFAAQPAIDIRPGTIDFDAMVERENMFYHSVYKAAVEIAQGNSDEIVLLFDIDQTISEGAGSDKVIRPAFARVIADLDQLPELHGRLRVGLLTNLPMDPNDDLYRLCMADIKPSLVEPTYAISTRRYRLPEAQARLMSSEDELAKVEELSPLIDPMIVHATKIEALNPHSWRDPDGKLEILQDLLHRTEGTRFVFIDNLVSTLALRADNPRLTGVCVGDWAHSAPYRIGTSYARTKLETARARAALDETTGPPSST